MSWVTDLTARVCMGGSFNGFWRALRDEACHELSGCFLVQVAAEAAQGSADDEGDEAEPTEQNGKRFEGIYESEESADEPETLPDSWETMAEEAAGHESAQESAGINKTTKATHAPSERGSCMMQSYHLPSVQLIATAIIQDALQCSSSAKLLYMLRLSELTNDSMSCRCFLSVI